MKEWGKDFKVQMKSKQTQMVSPRKGPQTQMSTAQVGNRNQSSGWQQEWWGPPAHAALYERNKALELLLFSGEPES